MGMKIVGGPEVLSDSQEDAVTAANLAVDNTGLSADAALATVDSMMAQKIPINVFAGTLLLGALEKRKKEPGEKESPPDAASGEFQKLVDGLLSRGAAVDKRVLVAGVQTNRSSVMKSLLAHYRGESADLPLLEAMDYCNPTVVSDLLNANAPVDMMDKDWKRQSLHKAALSKAPRDDIASATHLLLSHGADPNAKDILGRTALHYGVRKGVGVVQALCTGGGSAVARDNYGNLPSHALFGDIEADVKGDVAADPQIFHYLLSRAQTTDERKLILNGRNQGGKTPWDKAEELKRVDDQKLLAEEGVTPATMKAFETPVWTPDAPPSAPSKASPQDTQKAVTLVPNPASNISSGMQAALNEYHAPAAKPATAEAPTLMALKPASSPVQAKDTPQTFRA